MGATCRGKNVLGDNRRWKAGSGHVRNRQEAREAEQSPPGGEDEVVEAEWHHRDFTLRKWDAALFRMESFGLGAIGTFLSNLGKRIFQKGRGWAKDDRDGGGEKGVGCHGLWNRISLYESQPCPPCAG